MSVILLIKTSNKSAGSRITCPIVEGGIGQLEERTRRFIAIDIIPVRPDKSQGFAQRESTREDKLDRTTFSFSECGVWRKLLTESTKNSNPSPVWPRGMDVISKLDGLIMSRRRSPEDFFILSSGTDFSTLNLMTHPQKYGKDGRCQLLVGKRGIY